MTSLEAYLKDASHFRGAADKLLLPSSEKEICQILAQAQQNRTPLTVSGAGTGLTGARVPQGGMILSTEKLDRILEIKAQPGQERGLARIQPGVTLQQLETALQETGFFYPPDPGEKKASIGGTIATNASGPRSYRYGPTRKFVQNLRVVLPTGEIALLGGNIEGVREGFFSIPVAGGKTIRVPAPTYRQPKTKNSAGYFSGPTANEVDLFVGAEGTLGVVTEAELLLVQKPKALVSGVLFFDQEWDCFAFAQQMRLLPYPRRDTVRVLEFFDSKSLQILSGKHNDIPSHAGAALLFEEECSEAQKQPLLEIWTRAAEKAKARPSDCWFSHHQDEEKVFRRYRYDLPCMVNERAAKNGFRKLGTDLAVPDSSAQEMFGIYMDWLPKSGIDYALWGHVGDNHLHANLLPGTQEQFDQGLELYGRLAKKAIELGGTVSAEHGIGKARVKYLEWMVGRKGLEEMARIKKILDPAGILNRGNIIPEDLL